MNRLNKISNSEDEDEQPSSQELYLPHAERIHQTTEIIIPIDEGIQQPRYYRNAVERMNNLTEDDDVVFYINSEGGRLDGLLSLLDAIDNTKATCIARIAGECHSAASILALNCHEFHVSPRASMLVHFISFGSAGKATDVLDYVHHTMDQSKDLVQQTYKGFCTDEEIDEIIKGKQLWLRSDEIIRRLRLRVQYLQSLESPSDIPDPEEDTIISLN